jgi:ubiquinone/menaquinone biosynthesis C-methylase UbiE
LPGGREKPGIPAENQQKSRTVQRNYGTSSSAVGDAVSLQKQGEIYSILSECNVCRPGIVQLFLDYLPIFQDHKELGESLIWPVLKNSMAMKTVSFIIDLIRTGTSASHFYTNMNKTLKRLTGDYTMLHYPMEGEDHQTFIQGQRNLTDFCISLLGDISGQDILEIGCGNGVQAKYINESRRPGFVTGIDLEPGNIEIATEQQKLKNITNMLFLVDDAQVLGKIDNESMDIVISIESAFHYPDKDEFMRQVARVLKPDGKFLVADLLTVKKSKGIGIRKLWKGRMVLHHWNLDQYLDRFEKSPLNLEERVDITNPVIKGFRGYRRWISGIEKTGLVRDFFYRVFYTINAEWVLFLFRRRRKYMVFVGKRN